MDVLSVNTLLSVLGALSGLLALAVSLYVLAQERLRLDIFHPTRGVDCSWVSFWPTFKGYNAYGAPIAEYNSQCLILWLRIVNASKNPTTVVEISLRLPSKELGALHARSKKLVSIPVTYSQDPHGKVTSHSTRSFEALSIPIHLRPYDAIEGYFCFSDLRSIPQEPFRAYLTLKTPQKNVKHAVFVAPNRPELIEKETVSSNRLD